MTVGTANLSGPGKRISEPVAIKQAKKKRNRGSVKNISAYRLREPVGSFAVAPLFSEENSESQQYLLTVMLVGVCEGLK